MSSEEDPAEQLYHLFIMGLVWLREENPSVLARRGASVFSAYARGVGFLKSAKQLASRSWDLMELVRERSVIFEGDKHPGKRELQREIAQSDKHNIVLVVPAGELAPEKLFGAGGYSHAVTNAGIEFAHSVLAQYENLVSIDVFLQGWAKHKQQMVGYYNKAGGPGGKLPPSSGEGVADGNVGSKYIPPAPYGPADFDW